MRADVAMRFLMHIPREGAVEEGGGRGGDGSCRLNPLLISRALCQYYNKHVRCATHAYASTLVGH